MDLPSFKILKNIPKGKNIVVFLHNKGLKNSEDEDFPTGYFVANTMEEARKMVLEYIEYTKIEYENWNTAEVYENGKSNGYISFNGNYFFV